MLLMLTKGEAHLAAPELREPLRPGQVVCVPEHAARRLALATSFRMLIVHIGQALLSARITAPLPRSALVLSGDAAELFARLLQSMAASFDTIVSANAKAIQPFDNTMTACLDAALADSQPSAPPDMTPSRAAVFARVCSRIDARLAEPELSLAAIAADERMSARYLQKLFEKSGSGFSAYLRTSRLERCRADLANHQYDKLSVSDICYRWGFNDPSHFSHAFREQFGISPRAYREQTANTPEHRPPQNVSRGLPAHAKRAPASHGTPANDGSAARQQAAPTIVPITQARSHAARPECRHHWLQATDKTVHWGYLSHDLPPVLEVMPGDTVTIETLTQHASDDRERMIDGDAGAESVFHWTAEQKNVNRRGAGPIDASVYGRGAGEGFGVHICTGPVAVRGAMPGDVLEVRILDVRPRPCCNPRFAGRAFGSNAATWWGFHYRDMLTEPREREVVTVFEIDCERADSRARAVYNFR
jgi:AraC-type DNA-binding domain-containing proteins